MDLDLFVDTKDIQTPPPLSFDLSFFFKPPSLLNEIVFVWLIDFFERLITAQKYNFLDFFLAKTETKLRSKAWKSTFLKYLKLGFNIKLELASHLPPIFVSKIILITIPSFFLHFYNSLIRTDLSAIVLRIRNLFLTSEWS